MPELHGILFMSSVMTNMGSDFLCPKMGIAYVLEQSDTLLFTDDRSGALTFGGGL